MSLTIQGFTDLYYSILQILHLKMELKIVNILVLFSQHNMLHDIAIQEVVQKQEVERQLDLERRRAEASSGELKRELEELKKQLQERDAQVQTTVYIY